MLRVDRGADAQRDQEAAVAEIERRPARVEHALGEQHRFVAVGEVGGDQRELVAPDPCHRVGAADRVADAIGQLAQQPVAGRVTIGVVHVLEPVDVEHQDRGLRAVAPRPRQGLLEPVDQQQPVWQVGERIVRQQVAHPVLRAAAFRHLAQQRLVGRAQLHRAGGDGGLQPLAGIVQAVHQGGVLQMHFCRAAARSGAPASQPPKAPSRRAG